MKFKIMFSLCLMMIGFTYGQYDWTKGELVLRNGDTLSGYLKLPIINKAAVANSHKIKFKKGKKGKTTRYNHINVNKLIFKDPTNEEIYFFKYIKTSKSKYQLFKMLYNSDKIRLFARMVSEISAAPNINGFITSTGYYPSDYNEYYVQRKHERIASPLVKIGPLTKSFRKNAMKYFSDCPDLVTKLKNRDLAQSDLLRIIKEYDECE